jgi:RsmE family RNA methyltransferase
MQLFITPYTTKQKTLTISSPEVVEQARKVLRISSGDHFFVQDMQPGKQAQTRLEVQFSAFEKTHQGLSIVGEIVAEEHCPSNFDEISLCIAMPNKREKAELIIQKLCEIGIAHITFWPAERSIIKQWNEKKAERLQKIAKEAIEQSRGRFFPEISFVEKIATVLE